MTDYSFILRKMSADGQGYFSEEDRLRLLNAADRIAALEAALKPFVDLCDKYDGDIDEQALWDRDFMPKVGDLRAARAAMEGK